MKQKGFSVIELLIAIAIFVLFTASISVLMFSGEDLNRLNMKSYRALLYAQEGLEAVRTMRDGTWQNLSSGDHGLDLMENEWIFSGTSDVIDNTYRRTITLTAINEDKYEVLSKINWFNNYGEEKEISLKTYLTNWQRAQEIGDGGIDLGDSGKDLYVSGNYTYVAVDHQHSSLVVVDTSFPLNPQQIATVDLNGKGRDVWIDGDYAYVAINTNKVKILDVSDPYNPSLVSTINVSSQPMAVYVKDNYLYIGQDKKNEGLVMYNVANPHTPYYYNSYNVKSGVYDVKIVNGWVYMAVNAGRGFDVTDEGSYAYAYVAVDSESGGFETYYLWGPIISGIAVLDIGSEANNVFYYDDTAYVATKNEEGGLTRVDVSSVYYPQLINSTDINGEGNGVFYKDDYVYMAVENIDGGLRITEN